MAQAEARPRRDGPTGYERDASAAQQPASDARPRPPPGQLGGAPPRESFFSTTTAPMRSDDLDDHDGPGSGEGKQKQRERRDSSHSVMGRGRPKPANSHSTSSRPSSFFSPDTPSVSDFGARRPSIELGGDGTAADWPRTREPGGMPDSHESEGQTAGQAPRSRPNSFFGMPSPGAENAFTFPQAGGGGGGAGASISTAESSGAGPERRSSFYALDDRRPSGSASQSLRTRHLAGGDDSGSGSHSSHEQPRVKYQQAPYAASRAASLYGMGSEADFSMAPAPLLNQSHLQPGALASLLSHEKTLQLYRANAKKTNDPEVQFEFCTFVMEVVGEMHVDPTRAEDAESRVQRDALVAESVSLLSKLAHRGHVKSQYFLADCYTQGIGTMKGKRDYDKAYPLFLLAGKHGHADACFRAAQCLENGWGVHRGYAKAVSLLRRAAVLSHPGAMHRLGLAELNGELGLTKRPREGVKWLKRAAELADVVEPPQPQSLHELALLSAKGIDNVIFKDEEYAAELLARASELQYPPSAYKLGECYEYGKMGCPQDSALSIHYYNIAAQQNHREACFALTAWYLVGSPGVLPQSDTEAFLWAQKAAKMGLAKAEYAVGYFTEVGIGTFKDPREALEWFKKAAAQGDKRALDRLRLASGGVPPGAASFPRQPTPPHRHPSDEPPPPPPPSSAYKPPTMTKRLGKRASGLNLSNGHPKSAERSRRSDVGPASSNPDLSQPPLPRKPLLERQRSVSQPGALRSPYNSNDPYAEYDAPAPPFQGQRPEQPGYRHVDSQNQFRPIQSGQARMPNRQQRTQSPEFGVDVDAKEKMSTRDKVLQRRKAGDDKDCIIM